jgi:hypothetical protein
MVLAAGMFMMAVLAAAQTKDPFVGSWRLDTAKSKYSPGPMPKSQTTTYEASGPGYRVSVKSEPASGAAQQRNGPPSVVESRLPMWLRLLREILVFAQARLRKDEHALHENHGPGFDSLHALRTCVRGEVVDGGVDPSSGAKRLEVGDKELSLERRGVVVVQRRAHTVRNGALIAIVQIVRDHGGCRSAQAIHQTSDDGRLAAAGPAGDADEHGPHPPGMIPRRFLVARST